MMNAHALFSDRQARLFRWLFGQPERAFYLNELLRLTGLSSASLQHELKRLTETGVVLSKRTGNLRLLQANRASPVFAELLSLTRKTCSVPALLTQALAPLQGKLIHAWLYGSLATQEDHLASNATVLLVGHELTLAEVLELLQRAEAALGRKVDPTCLSLAEFERQRDQPDSFVSRVLAQPKLDLIHEHDHGQ
jgi:hypothetical protein